MLQRFDLASFTITSCFIILSAASTPCFMILSAGAAEDRIMKHDVEKVKERRALLARVSLFSYARHA
jgi:hypothetical protein